MPVVYEIPPRKTPGSDNEYLEQMTKAIFQAGFSWAVIRNKWDSFRKAFDGFDIDKVAAYSLEDLERLAEDASIVRNRQKIAATVENAGTMKRLIGEFGSFKAYLSSLQGDYYSRAEELRKTFRHLGRTGVFVFLYCVNEEVPGWEDR
ncbi:MAG: DNA-3-methyladenine glycosylase I [Fidelibacterota bacterium]